MQAADRFVSPAPLRNSHPTALAEGCRGAAGEILVLTQAGHDSCVWLKYAHAELCVMFLKEKVPKLCTFRCSFNDLTTVGAQANG